MSTVTDLSSEDRLNNVKENLAGVREVIVKADTIVDGEYYALVGGSILTFLFGTTGFFLITIFSLQTRLMCE